VQIGLGSKTESVYCSFEQNEVSHILEFVRIKERQFWQQQKKLYPACEELFNKTIAWMTERDVRRQEA
jgi:hypothetical protein